MSLHDWASNSLQHYQTKRPPEATMAMLTELSKGIKARLQLLKSRVNGGRVEMDIAGAQATVIADSRTEVKRAQHLNGEKPVFDWLSEAIDEETVCWDIGGYHGHYAVLMSALGGHVIAFEPNAENRERLRKHLSMNDATAICREYALSDQNAVQRLAGPATNELSVTEADSSGWKVQTKRGDSVAPRPEVLKIDVEGHEQQVLDGLRTTLPEIDRVVVEVHDGVDGKQIKDQLRQADLSVVEIPTIRSQTYLGGVRE